MEPTPLNKEDLWNQKNIYSPSRKCNFYKESIPTILSEKLKLTSSWLLPLPEERNLLAAFLQYDFEIRYYLYLHSEVLIGRKNLKRQFSISSLNPTIYEKKFYIPEEPKIFRTEHIKRFLSFSQDFLQRMHTNIMLYLPLNTCSFQVKVLPAFRHLKLSLFLTNSVGVFLV